MKLVAQLVSFFALAAGSGSLDDGSPSLLQLRAANAASPEQHVLYNSSDKTQPRSGHPFGCTGSVTAVNVIQCGLWGDVHQHQKFQGGGHPDSFGTGWYWIAKSRDGAFQAQAFYRQNGGGWTTMSHYAFRFGDNTLFMDRENDGSSWMWKYYWNGQERSFQDTPVNIDGVYWINRARGELANNAAQGLNAHGIMTGSDAQRHSCFEFQNVAVWTGYQNWQNVNMGPYGQPGIMEIEGSIEYLDPDYGQCAANQLRVDPSDMLVTIAQNNKVCNDDSLDAHQCEDPDPPPPPSTAQQLCESNGVAFQHAQDLCAGQDSHGADIYDGCVYDVCASVDADAEQNAVGGAEMEAAQANPRATCMVSPEPCTPCNICSSATRADLSNVVQNNLGGVGPDPSGAEEIRYQNAINLGGGRLVDVVLVANGVYQTVPNRRGIIPNGNNGQGFGRFTLETGTASDFTFLFQDSTTGAPVSIPDISLTFYDLDEARNRLQRETITACGVEEVYVTEDTELLYTSSGTCHSFQSSVVGTGADNPKTASELTKTQAARSVTYEFHSRASINWRADVSGNRWSPRPILFSFEPQVACGASDSETQCAPGPVLQNRDFEVGFTTDNYEYTHNVWGWTATGGVVAVRTNNAPWGGIVAQTGDYLLALQSNAASVAQTAIGFVPGRSYTLRVSAAQRTNSPGGPNAVLKVSANGQELLNRVVSATAMEVQSMTFTADTSAVELKFENVVGGGDQTVFIDAVEVSEAPPAAQNGDFEAGFTTNNFEYTNDVAGWTAAGGVVSIRTNNGPWGGIVAQTGNYLLGLQSNGASVTQTVANFRAGVSYSLRVSAAQRTNSPGGPNAVLKVSANGQELLNRVVSATAMEVQSMTFIADASAVELKFENVVGGGDQTVFIDAVEVSQCLGFSVEACTSAAQAMGFQLGGEGYQFTGNFQTKGCYAYTSGQYSGRAYYGLLNNAEVTDSNGLNSGAAAASPKFRPSGIDCSP